MTTLTWVWIYFALFLVLMIVSIPIPFAMMASTLLYCLQVDYNLALFAQRTATSFADYTLLAVPTFVFVGCFMNETGLTDDIFDVCKKGLGHIPGGLAHANVVASMVFAGMSGSVQADAGGLGYIEIETMTRAGYDKEYSCAITACSSIIGPIIPPSINLVVFGYLAQVSTLSLFLGGLLPGVLMGLSMMVLVFLQAKKGVVISKETLLPKAPAHEVWKAFYKIIPVLFGPIILILGILSGAFTPTECGCMCAMYCVVLAIAKRRMNFRTIVSSLKRTLSTTAVTMFLISTGSIFNWMIITGGVLDVLTDFLLAIGNKYLMLMVLNVIMLFMGCFMGNMSILVMLTPLVVGLANTMGMDLVHIGVMMVLNLTIGCVTPPFAPAVFTACKVSDANFEKTVKFTAGFLIPLAIVLLVVTYVPITVILLPTILG